MCIYILLYREEPTYRSQGVGGPHYFFADTICTLLLLRPIYAQDLLSSVQVLMLHTYSGLFNTVIVG